MICKIESHVAVDLNRLFKKCPCFRRARRQLSIMRLERLLRIQKGAGYRKDVDCNLNLRYVQRDGKQVRTNRV